MRPSSGAEDSSSPADPWDVLSGLALLVVEGRTPGGEKGFHAGPHCPLMANTRPPPPHFCTPSENSACGRAMSLLRQLRIMWGAGVGVSIEVFLAPECEHGTLLTSCIDTTATAPKHRLKLIEHWNFAVNHNKSVSGGIGGMALVAAVRSFLHFSQLSAWLSLSEGNRRLNVVYRLTVTSPLFHSKFEGSTETHVFPVASFGPHTSIQVSVKTLSRTAEIPISICSEKHGEVIPSNLGDGKGSSTLSSSARPSHKPQKPFIGDSLNNGDQNGNSVNGNSVNSSSLASNSNSSFFSSSGLSSDFSLLLPQPNFSSSTSPQTSFTTSPQTSFTTSPQTSFTTSPQTSFTNSSSISNLTEVTRCQGSDSSKNFQPMEKNGNNLFQSCVSPIASSSDPSSSKNPQLSIRNASTPLKEPHEAISLQNLLGGNESAAPLEYDMPPSVSIHHSNGTTRVSVSSDFPSTRLIQASSSQNFQSSQASSSQNFQSSQASSSQNFQSSQASSSQNSTLEDVIMTKSEKSADDSSTNCNELSTAFHQSSTSGKSSQPHLVERPSTSSSATDPSNQNEAKNEANQNEAKNEANQNEAKNGPVAIMCKASCSSDGLHSDAAKSSKSDNLRVSVMRSQLEESSGSSRGSSPDSIQLGESLLDPPHAARIPRCYHSPSRSGSPSRETPDHIMGRPRHYSVSDIRISGSKSEGKYSLNGNQEALSPQSVIGGKGQQPQVVIGGTHNPVVWAQSRYPCTTLHCQAVHNNYQQQHKHLFLQTNDNANNNNLRNSTDSDCMESCSNGNSSLSDTIRNQINIERSENNHEKLKNVFGSSSVSDTINMDSSVSVSSSVSDTINTNSDLKEGERSPSDLKLDLSYFKKMPEFCDDGILPPDEWSPRSRNLLLQHIGGGGTKRKGENWEEVSVSKGRRKDKMHVLVNSKKDNHENHGISKQKRPSFELSSEETVEILKVLHRKPHSPLRKNNYLSRCPHYLMGRPFKDNFPHSKPIDIKTKPKTLPSTSFPSSQPADDSSDPHFTSYRSFQAASDSEEEREDETDKPENLSFEKKSKENLSFEKKSKEIQSVEARTVRSSTQFYCATSEVLPATKMTCQKEISVSMKTDDSSTVSNNSCSSASFQNGNSDCNSQNGNGDCNRQNGNSDCQNGSNDFISLQVANIGERVRRTLSFDSEDESPNAPSKDVSKPPNLFKSLMKRSYQVCSESTWNSCKLAKPDTASEQDSEMSLDAGPSLRPDSPGTLLNDEEVARITSNGCHGSPVAHSNRCHGTLSAAIDIPSDGGSSSSRPSLKTPSKLAFHFKTGLPLTSSPAPLRKGGSRFDFDSSLNSVAAIKRSTSFHSSAYPPPDSDASLCGSDCECVCSTEVCLGGCRPALYSTSAPATVTSSNLLGTFEECVLHGRLEPVSTVQGFRAEIAASGSFCPEHITKPVTVFFYTLCDNDHFSSPYMGHVRLEKKGYKVPPKGTVQVTLLNPLGTVVKMFVVMYDLSDMPPNARTFLRQRTLNMPVGASDLDPDAHQWLRYLIHLKFASSKSGKVYLHTDIRMLIFRKSDADAAAMHKTSLPYELRSFTHGPTNPKYSPRK